MKELKFATEDQAMQYLSDITGKRIKVAGTSPDTLKFDKLKEEAKKLGDYMFKTQMPNYDQIKKKIKSIAKRMINTGMVLGETNKKNLEQISKGNFDFSENRSQNMYHYAVGLLSKAGKDYYTQD